MSQHRFVPSSDAEPSTGPFALGRAKSTKADLAGQTSTQIIRVPAAPAVIEDGVGSPARHSTHRGPRPGAVMLRIPRPGSRSARWQHDPTGLTSRCASASARKVVRMTATGNPGLGPQKALVTGATSGLGRAIAQQLASDGLEVIMHGRDATRGAAAVEQVERAGGTARFAAADLSDMTGIERMAAEG